MLADSSGSKPDGPGVCELRCETRSDCVPAGGDDDDWECDGGFCSDVAFELCDPFTCEIQGNGVCAVVTGLSTCTTPCTAGGSECAQLEGCLGNDDLGNPICTPLPCGGVAEGEPCVTSTGEDRGTCIGGECICMVDEECTADGHACNRG